MNSNLSAHSFVSHHPDAVAREIGDEMAVVLNLGSGVYYRLDRSAAHIWKLLAERPVKVDEVVQTIVDEWEVEAERCERDLFAFISELSIAGLVEIDDSEGGQPAAG
jgi:hypothetical protein